MGNNQTNSLLLSLSLSLSHPRLRDARVVRAEDLIFSIAIQYNTDF